MKESDTPRTDAIQFQPLPISMSIENEMLRSLSRQLERELAASQAEVEELKQQKRNCLEIIDDDAKERSELKAEVERLNSELSDMECEVWPEMARLKAEVAFWKAKAHEAEDREGKHEAEVEHIKALLKDIPAVHTNTLRGNIATLSWDSYEHIIGPHPCRERAENAGSEVERLKSQLARAVEIAEIGIKYITTGGEWDSEAFPKDTGWVTDEEIEDWQRKLDALKGEIK